MSACRFEVGPFAFTCGVQMKSMLARRDARCGQSKAQIVAICYQLCGAGRNAISQHHSGGGDTFGRDLID